MKRTFLSLITLATLLLFTVVANTQNAAILAKPDEQAKVKPIILDLKKLDQARTAKIAALPEAQAVRDAEAALAKAKDALDKAAGNLPETATWKETYAKLLDESYKIQAAHSLSSREFQPTINDKDELAFVKFTPPKP